MMENSMSPADIAAVTGSNNRGGFGEDGGGLIWIIVLFALFGFGGNGFGGFGKNGAGAGDLSGFATKADINSGFALNGIERGIQSIQNGLCDSTYAMTNLMNSGFSSAELSRCNQQAMIMQQLNNMSFQNQQCCCDVRGDVKDVMYADAKNTCDIQNTVQNASRDNMDATRYGNDRIIARLDQMEANHQKERYQAILAENQTLKFQASQVAQNGYIDAIGNNVIATLRQPQPVPSYSVPAPYPYGYNNCGCGCNSGCGC